MRVLIAILLVVFVALQFKLWVSDGGARKVWRLRDEVAQTTQQNRKLAERNAELAAEVKDLKHGLVAVEERARNELGFVKSDESFYEIVSRPEERTTDKTRNGTPFDVQADFSKPGNGAPLDAQNDALINTSITPENVDTGDHRRDGVTPSTPAVKTDAGDGKTR